MEQVAATGAEAGDVAGGPWAVWRGEGSVEEVVKVWRKWSVNQVWKSVEMLENVWKKFAEGV